MFQLAARTICLKFGDLFKQYVNILHSSILELLLPFNLIYVRLPNDQLIY